MANVTFNPRVTSDYPATGRDFGKREVRASTHNNSLADCTASLALVTTDAISQVRLTQASGAPLSCALPIAAKNMGRIVKVYNAGAIPAFILQNADKATVEGETALVKTYTTAFGTHATYLTATAHGLVTGDAVTVASTTTLSTGLSAATVYFVTRVDANNFTLSATKGGSAISLTGDGSGTQTFTQVLCPLAQTEWVELFCTGTAWLISAAKKA